MTDRSLAALRTEAKEHARQLAAVKWVTVQELADRWGIDPDTVRAIPRGRLPYLEFGKSRMRRYDPRHIERYEDEESRPAASEASQ